MYDFGLSVHLSKTFVLLFSLSPSLSPQYEYKVKGVRKKRCYIEMSVSGVKISKRKSKRVSPVKFPLSLSLSLSHTNNQALMRLCLLT